MISAKDTQPYDATRGWRHGIANLSHRYHPYTRIQDPGPSFLSCVQSPRSPKNAAATASCALPFLNHTRSGPLSLNELMNPRPYSPPPVPGDAQCEEMCLIQGARHLHSRVTRDPESRTPTLWVEARQLGNSTCHFTVIDKVHPTIHEGETLLLEGELERHWEVEKKVNEHGEYSLMSIKQSRHRLTTVLAVRHERVAALRFSADTQAEQRGGQDTVEAGGSIMKLPRSARNMGNKKVALPYWVENLNPTNYQGQRYYQ
ncbi:hypothetical protein DFH06DRAFT_1126193 [Mycena polygramma]|nr:hypothetical protein DFH06DRAFT_1126193 [Mycena polygramma]